MDGKEQRDALEYAIMQRDNRLWDEFNESDEEVKKECECGNYIDADEKMCNDCKHSVQARFKQFIFTEFNEEELEYLDDYLDGRYLTQL